MTAIPLIIGFGGINPAGRGSFHHAYRRTVMGALPANKAQRTLHSLAALMLKQPLPNDDQHQSSYILNHTLIRRIENHYFDVDHVPFNKGLVISSDDNHPAGFVISKRHLPTTIPDHWIVTELGRGLVHVAIDGSQNILLPSTRRMAVQSAGQLPSGFDPGQCYPSRQHPRALEMTIYGASDALGSLGIDWETICSQVTPDHISVYAGSAMSQLDQYSNAGMLSARFDGKRVTSKQCPFGLLDMPADFINAYVLGTLGATGACVGACASFLYNLRLGMTDIQSGAARIAIVGCSEAPIVPDIIDGYVAMGALATDEALAALDAKCSANNDGSQPVDHRRACRPFGNNCGFTLGESAQYVILCDDALAIELGATVYGAVSNIFINADGYKKSIASPGVGNYITVAKAVAAARSILGEQAVQHRSFIQAHGTGTPQNRVTESHIFNEIAKLFGIEQWPVAAIKSYLGHSLGSAAGDQLLNTLGIWEEGIIPGITTIDQVADDVHHSRLAIRTEHQTVGKDTMDVAILNSKGFGGNNASATVLAPHVVNKMLINKWGTQSIHAYQRANESVRERATAFDEAAMQGTAPTVYRFDYRVLEACDLRMDERSIRVPGYNQVINLDTRSPYADWITD